MRVRSATAPDAAVIASIYNQGVEERSATFETTLLGAEDVLAWFDGVHPVVVVESDDDVVAFARTSAYRPRECYQGIFEFSVYTERSHRRRGAAAAAMRDLITQTRAAGAWKLVSRIFVDNDGSRALMAALGFREVGVYYRHAKLDDKWRDVVIVEKFLAPLGAVTSVGPPALGASGAPAANAASAPRAARTSRDGVLEALRSSERLAAPVLAQARALLEMYKRADDELLVAAADAFFASRHDASVRAAFVDLFREYAAHSSETGAAVLEALFARLDRRSVAADLDVFYETLYVVKKLVPAGRAPELTPHLPKLFAWLKQTVDLPRTMRSRISPANVTSLAMSLATSAAESDEQRRELATLSSLARERHRVEAPVSIRSPSADPSGGGPRDASSDASADASAVETEPESIELDAIELEIPTPPPPRPSRPPPLPSRPPPLPSSSARLISPPVSAVASAPPAPAAPQAAETPAAEPPAAEPPPAGEAAPRAKKAKKGGGPRRTKKKSSSKRGLE